VLVVNVPLALYQNTGCFDRPIGRIAARSFLDTDSTRVRESFAINQSVRVVPRKRKGDAPGPAASISVTVVSFTPAEFVDMPV
jgi:hypothetical protein